MEPIAYQPDFRPALPVVFGAKDYREFRSTLEEMDRILTKSGTEDRLVARQIKALGKKLTPRQVQRHARCSTRRFATAFCRESPGFLIANCLCGWWTAICSSGLPGRETWMGCGSFPKARLHALKKMFSAAEIGELVHGLSLSVANKEQAHELLLQKIALRFDKIFADGICVKANIHFPVDWVLLRDAARTLVQAIELIRAHGLKHRIGPPERMLRDMNKLCMEMTHSRRKLDAKKARKKIFRRMKKLVETISCHAGNYIEVLEARWPETDWTEIEAGHVLARIRNVLDPLPQAVKQAHERIIGGRGVANSEKIFSLYEPDVRVRVRGKAGAEVEFGNELYLAEQIDGPIASYATDRGFDSAANRIVLEDLEIINAMCPRSVAGLREKLEDETFCALQKRRAKTEGRIGVFKNAYLGTPLRSKGFQNRKVRIACCILVHNLWKLGRMAAIHRENRMTERAQTG